MSAKKQVFKAALDVPWREWPDQLSEVESLFAIFATVSDHSTDVNNITTKLSDGSHNLVVAAKLTDGFPFFMRHIPACVYASNAYLVVVSEGGFVRLLELLRINGSCRCLSVKVDPSRLSHFKPFNLCNEYPTNVAVMNKLIKQ